MTKEERAEKWSRGIPEMECLTQQEKEEICRRVTFQLLVLTGLLAGAALCCLFFLHRMSALNSDVFCVRRAEAQHLGLQFPTPEYMVLFQGLNRCLEWLLYCW